MAPKRGLGSKGKGIEALINNRNNDTPITTYNNAPNNLLNADSLKSGIYEVDLNMIERNKNQPRKHFQEEALNQLADSLKEYGMLQPIIVKKKNDYFEIIAGERRWRAAKIAGLKKIPVIEKDCKEMESFQIALVENIQRESLNPIEEAESFCRLRDEFGLSQERIAELVGKNRSSITNAMRLLNLRGEVMQYVRDGRISGGHGRTLLAVIDPDDQYNMAEQIIEEELSVRSTEKLVKEYLAKLENEKLLAENPPTKVEEIETFPEVDRAAIEESLKNIFSAKVKINHNKNKGKIEINYHSEDELDRILGIIKGMDGA